MEIEIFGFRFYKGINIEALIENVERTFHIHTSFRGGVLDVGLSYDSKRNQYNSIILLDLLKQKKRKSTTSKIIGLTDIDLFFPIFKYVFGEAELNGEAAVVSSHRFHNELYGLPKNDQLLDSKIQKEIIHVLGHTFGLNHCSDSYCVMHPSTYVESINIKENSFCDNCLMELRIKKSKLDFSH